MKNTARTAEVEDVKLALVGFPYDENSSFLKGAADAPPLIRAALRSDASNLWSEPGIDLGSDGIFFDSGDVEPIPGTEMFALIEDSIRALLSDNFTPISLGGDHSVTYPIIRAVSKKYPELSILHFDAHPDLYDELQGNRYLHACPFSRIMEEGLAKRLVQVGIRTINGQQKEQARRFGVETIEMRHWRDDLVLEFDSWIRFTSRRRSARSC